ncbi:hypothetical protein LSAT2_017852 [Lamellibrachia satsuma]|nr:hypothetical protein LSAT2_017852 [Lamellibrachia satsuma]
MRYRRFGRDTQSLTSRMTETTDPSISGSAIQVMKLMASDPLKSKALVQDDTCLGGLVMVLSNSDTCIVTSALETLFRLAEWPEHRSHMKNFIGMVDQLQAVASKHTPNISELAEKVYNLLLGINSNSTDQVPLKETSNKHRAHKEVTLKRRRNSFFIDTVLSRSKMVTLQIRGLIDRDDMDVCRNSLLTVKGVISITFDFRKRRAMLRTVPELRPELLAQAIARTMTMTAEQVIKDEVGNEVFVSFKVSLPADKENEEEMPDYPDDDSPIRGTNNLARVGHKEDNKRDWGFVRSVSSFLSNSFYW